MKKSYVILIYSEIVSELSKEELEEELKNGEIKLENPTIKVLEKT